MLSEDLLQIRKSQMSSSVILENSQDLLWQYLGNLSPRVLPLIANTEALLLLQGLSLLPSRQGKKEDYLKATWSSPGLSRTLMTRF